MFLRTYGSRSESVFEKNTSKSEIRLRRAAYRSLEIESTLNSRPLTYVSSDELDEPITHSHLVVGRRVNSIPIASSASGVEQDKIIFRRF